MQEEKCSASRLHQVRSTILKCAVHAPQQCHASGVGLRLSPSTPVQCRQFPTITDFPCQRNPVCSGHILASSSTSSVAGL